MVGKSGPSFCQGLHTKNGLDLLLAHGHGPVGLAKPYLIFYPLHHPTKIMLKMLLSTTFASSSLVTFRLPLSTLRSSRYSKRLPELEYMTEQASVRTKRCIPILVLGS